MARNTRRTYARDAKGRFASTGSTAPAKSARAKAATEPAAKAKPARRSAKGAQRRSSGQASWARGYLRLNDQGLTRNKRALLSPEQQRKAQEARSAFGTHNARKMAVRKLSDQQLAKAELAKRRSGKRSTAPDPNRKPRSAYRSRGKTGMEMAKEFGIKLSSADAKLIRKGDRAAKRKYGKIDRLSIKDTGRSRYGVVIRLDNRSGQAARLAALKARAAGESAGAAFSKGLRAGELVRAQRSLNRAAGRAIGQPTRKRLRQAFRKARRSPA